MRIDTAGQYGMLALDIYYYLEFWQMDKWMHGYGWIYKLNGLFLFGFHSS
jgi:hypothetical protein